MKRTTGRYPVFRAQGSGIGREGESMSIDVLLDPVFSRQAAQRKATFRNKLEATTTILEQADTMPRGTARDKVLGAAENKLQNDVMANSDGSLGGNPSNDWITDPA